MTEPTTAPCYDRGCLHYDHEEPPCVGHMPSICCAKLSAAIGAAAVADYRSATPAPTVAQLAEAMRETGRQVFAGGESMPVAFYVPWARDILAAQPAAPEPPVCTCYPGTDEHDYSCPTAWAARNPRPPEPDRTEALVNALVKNIQDALVHLEHEHYGWAIQSLDAALAAQPAAPHEPERFTGQMTWPCVCGHIKGAHYFGDALGADGQMHTWCQMNVIGGHCTDFRPAPEAEPEPSGPFDVGPPDTGDH